ncbi:MAG: hypothetical protein HWN68_18435 [Desulfobacterales bacterium]|nr:hypothetical protein [Desulfobacterales bacterium]
MWYIAIGVVAVVAIVVVAVLKGIDGALAMTGLSVIGGLMGWTVKKAKDEGGIGKAQIPVVEIKGTGGEETVIIQPVPQRAKVAKSTKMIDFGMIEIELREYIASEGWRFRYSTLYSLAHNRMVGLKIDTLGQAVAGTDWLLGLANEAFMEAFHFEPSYDLNVLEQQKEQYRKDQCRWLTDHEGVCVSWVVRLLQHKKGLERLGRLGVDWQKVPNTHKTVWMIGELAMNPAIVITKDNESKQGQLPGLTDRK